MLVDKCNSLFRYGCEGDRLVSKKRIAAILICLIWGVVSQDVIAFDNPRHSRSALPNILVLYADDLGYGDLPCYNPDSKIPTPNLDLLASQGIRFTDAHSSSGICTPSRYALLTGQYHWRDFHGIVSAFGPSVFKTDQLTIPKMLQQRGYSTAAIGKWHLGWDWEAIKQPGAMPRGEEGRGGWGPEAFDWSQSIPGGPTARGFDTYFGDSVINFPPYCWIENDRVVEVPDKMMDTKLWKPIKEGNWECRPGPMVSDWDPYQNIPVTTQRGVEYILSRQESDQPFFLYFSYPSPHAPIIPNDQFDGISQAGAYGDFVYETDHSIGQLLDALEKSGKADNTLVIFSADNGAEHYAYARDVKFGHWSSHPLRGLKRDFYEGGHRVPLIVRWPDEFPSSRVCDALVSQIDLMATLAAIIDYELPDSAAVDSNDMTPLWRGKVDSVRTSHVHNTSPNRYGIRDEHWLLIDSRDGYVSSRNVDWEKRHGYPQDDELPVELYNLKIDLGQRDNLAAQHPQIVEQLRQRLLQIQNQGHSAARLESIQKASPVGN